MSQASSFIIVLLVTIVFTESLLHGITLLKCHLYLIFSTLQRATIISWHLFCCKLWRPNKNYEFFFLAHHRSVNKKACCHQSNANRYFQSGVQQKERQCRWRICKPEKCSFLWSPNVDSSETMGRPTDKRKCLYWSLIGSFLCKRGIQICKVWLAQIALSLLVRIVHPHWLLLSCSHWSVKM